MLIKSNQCEKCDQIFKSGKGRLVHQRTCSGNVADMPSAPAIKLVMCQAGPIISQCSGSVEEKTITRYGESQSQSYLRDCYICLEEAIPIQMFSPVCDSNHMVCADCMIQMILGDDHSLTTSCSVCRQDSLFYFEKFVRFIYYRFFLKTALISHLHELLARSNEYGFSIEDICKIKDLLVLTSSRGDTKFGTAKQLEHGDLIVQYKKQRKYIQKYVSERGFLTETQKSLLPSEYLNVLFQFILAAPLDFKHTFPDQNGLDDPRNFYSSQFIETGGDIQIRFYQHGRFMFRFRQFYIEFGSFALNLQSIA